MQTTKTTNKSPLRFLWLLLILLVLLVSLRNFFIITVQGTSMAPTLNDGDKVLCKAVPEISQGDIVICSSAYKSLVKRVVALPGQTVRIVPETGVILVDGEPFDAFASPRTSKGEDAWEGAYAGAEITVPEGCIFVLGDNRSASYDSMDASVGFIQLSHVYGIVIHNFSRKE